MKSFNIKLALSALGIIAVLPSAAFAHKPHHIARANPMAIYNVVPGYTQDARTMEIPGYDQDGRTVDIPNPDQYGIQSQR
ncbi:MAG TPA: hypothetical protein VHX43_03815 [Xanthobacteraceae bacterium]|jgi:hypothetical protein|nr:hypothetical protein [Xanthobacteraceae bacterium]